MDTNQGFNPTDEQDSCNIRISLKYCRVEGNEGASVPRNCPVSAKRENVRKRIEGYAVATQIWRLWIPLLPRYFFYKVAFQRKHDPPA